MLPNRTILLKETVKLFFQNVHFGLGILLSDRELPSIYKSLGSIPRTEKKVFLF
jgi:hypothetical protein